MIFEWILRSILDYFWLQNVIKNRLIFRLIFEWIFDDFWDGFWEPKGIKNQWIFWLIFWLDFGRALGRQMEATPPLEWTVQGPRGRVGKG